MVPKVVVRVVAGFAVVLGTVGAAALAGGSGAAGAATPQAMPVPSTGVSAPMAFVANTGANTITSFPLSASGNADPANTITSTPTRPLHQPWEIAFDAAGDLWAANCSSNAVIEYTATQLTSGGAKLPSVVVSDDGSGSLVCPQGLAFDAAGDLWVGNIGTTGATGPPVGSLVEFTPAQLAHSGDPTPAVTITSSTAGPPIAGPYGITFDAAGDLWVSDYSVSTITEYAATQLTSSGNPTPAGVIHGTDITGPTGLTFDAAGDLWVANYGHGSTSGNSVVEITSTALAAGGTVTAAVVIGDPPASSGPLATPADVAFDATGNLWVTNTGNDTVVEYAATQLTSSGTPTPMVTLSSDATGSLDGPTGNAFDAAGGLWVANVGGNSLVRFSPAQLTSSGSPTPAVTITAAGRASLQRPVGEAMDAAGDLWAANLDGNSLVEYTATQLGQSGPLDPAVTIRSNGENATPTPTTGPEPCVATPTTPSSTTGSLVCPAFMAFDSAGDLWVANYMGNTLVEYTPAQLAQSGDPTPAVTISAPDDCFEGTSPPGITTTAASAAGLCGPAGLAFDAHGDLWVTNLFLPSVVEYTAAQLAQSGSPTPATVIGTTNPTTSTGPHSLLDPLDDTFDAAGNLWVSNAVYGGPTAGGTLLEYTAAQLAHSGTPTPAVTVSSTGGTSTGTGPASLSAPSGLEFDTTGNLWVANTGSDSLVAFTPAQLVHSGAPAPADTIVGTATGLDEPNGLAIAVPPPPPPANGQGYWEVASDGGIFSFGSAQFYGSMGGKPLNAPVNGIAGTPTGGGYWEVASDGGIFAFGNAQFHGSMGGKPLNAPVVGIAATPTGGGYWEVAADGGIFAFGNAQFHGSMGGKPLNAPVVGIAAAPTGQGYWEVAADGGIFAFGSAQFYGSMGGKPLNAPVNGIAATPTGHGYWEVASDGGIFAFGSAQFQGSMGGKPLNRPVVGLAAA